MLHSNTSQLFTSRLPILAAAGMPSALVSSPLIHACSAVKQTNNNNNNNDDDRLVKERKKL